MKEDTKNYQKLNYPYTENNVKYLEPGKLVAQ